MSRHDGSLPAKQFAVTRRSARSSKQSRSSSRTASVAYPRPAWSGWKARSQLRLHAAGLVHHLGLGPGVLDGEHQVADDLAVPLRDERLGQGRLLEVRPVAAAGA